MTLAAQQFGIHNADAYPQELNEPENVLAGEGDGRVEEIEEVEEVINRTLTESTYHSRKRKSTWRGQAELLNSPYKASSIFKDDKLLETIKISEDSDTNIIRKTGLLGDYELELDLASDEYVIFHNIPGGWIRASHCLGISKKIDS